MPVGATRVSTVNLPELGNVVLTIAQGASTTAGHADTMADKQSLRIKKMINRPFDMVKSQVVSRACWAPAGASSC